LKKAETKFKEKVQKDLKTLNNCWFVKIQQASIRGIPDILMCLCGTFVAIELKRAEDAPRNKLQEWTLHAISHANGMSFICTPENWEETFMIFEHMDEEGTEESFELDRSH